MIIFGMAPTKIKIQRKYDNKQAKEIEEVEVRCGAVKFSLPRVVEKSGPVWSGTCHDNALGMTWIT